MCSFVGFEKWKKNGGAATKFALTKVKKPQIYTRWCPWLFPVPCWCLWVLWKALKCSLVCSRLLPCVATSKIPFYVNVCAIVQQYRSIMVYNKVLWRKNPLKWSLFFWCQQHNLKSNLALQMERIWNKGDSEIPGMSLSVITVKLYVLVIKRFQNINQFVGQHCGAVLGTVAS